MYTPAVSTTTRAITMSKSVSVCAENDNRRRFANGQGVDDDQGRGNRRAVFPKNSTR